MVDLIKNIVTHWKEISTQALIIVAAFGGTVKAIETLLQIIAPMTPWEWDDNLATILGKLLANKIFQKKQQ